MALDLVTQDKALRKIAEYNQARQQLAGSWPQFAVMASRCATLFGEAMAIVADPADQQAAGLAAATDTGADFAANVQHIARILDVVAGGMIAVDGEGAPVAVTRQNLLDQIAAFPPTQG